ncbi:SSI family serine proteinase inhibitor [Streptomyces sp. NPDC054765]
MPHRRTSALFAAAASAATTAVTRLSAVTAASATAAAVSAVSAVSVTAALALAAPAASAAPIPLPYRLYGNGITGAGHRTPDDHHALTGHDTPTDPHTFTDHGAPIGPQAPTGHVTPAGHGPSAGHVTPTGLHAPTGHGAPAGHGTPAGYGAAGPHRAPKDHLTVTVHDSGSAATNGTFELYCHPGGGNHLHVKGACDKLDGMTKWGKDPFAPVPQSANCTMMYGGPATAHVTGTWAGRPVNADFRRTNGCEISRWGRFEPLLPSTSS